jgi:hypothetical protein
MIGRSEAESEARRVSEACRIASYLQGAEMETVEKAKYLAGELDDLDQLALDTAIHAGIHSIRKDWVDIRLSLQNAHATLCSEDSSIQQAVAAARRVVAAEDAQKARAIRVGTRAAKSEAAWCSRAEADAYIAAEAAGRAEILRHAVEAAALSQAAEEIAARVRREQAAEAAAADELAMCVRNAVRRNWR